MRVTAPPLATAALDELFVGEPSHITLTIQREAVGCREVDYRGTIALLRDRSVIEARFLRVAIVPRVYGSRSTRT